MSQENSGNKEIRARLSDRMWDMLEEIRKFEGFEHYTETVRFLIREKYKEIRKEKFDV